MPGLGRIRLVGGDTESERGRVLCLRFHCRDRGDSASATCACTGWQWHGPVAVANGLPGLRSPRQTQVAGVYCDMEQRKKKDCDEDADAWGCHCAGLQEPEELMATKIQMW